MKTLFKKISVLCFSLIVITAIGCKSDETKADVKEVYGTAAVGAAIVGTVNIKGSDGKRSYSSIMSDGSYTVDVSALTPPFVIFVEGTVGSKTVRLYSTIEDAGRANVTPATHLAMTLAIGDDPATMYPPADMTADDVEIPLPPSPSALEDAKATITAILANVFSSLGVDANFDIMNGEFIADGSGFDSLLDTLNMDVDTSTGNAVVQISDATLGTMYYAQDASTGEVTFRNTDIMEAATGSAVDDLALINEFYTTGVQKFVDNTSDEATYRANLATMYASDYLEEGRTRAQQIDNDVAKRSEMAGVTIAVNNITIGEPLADYVFTADAESVSMTLPGESTADTFTFKAGKATMGFPANAQVVKVSYEMVFTRGAETFHEKGIDFLIKEGENWKDWGDRSISQETNIETSMERRISKEYNTTLQGYEDIDVISTGYSMYCNDFGNAMLQYYEVNALLVLGDGITAEYAPGKKGILLMQNSSSMDTYYRIVNVANTYNNNVYDSAAGLDIAAITSPVVTVIGLYYNSTDKTFTPKRVWSGNTEGAIPLSLSVLTEDYFATFITPADPDLNLYTQAVAMPFPYATFTLAYSWNNPVKSGMVFEHVSYWFGGNPESGTIPGSADTSSWRSYQADFDASEVANNQYTLDFQDGTDIFKLNNCGFTLSYGDSEGHRFETRYNLQRTAEQ